MTTTKRPMSIDQACVDLAEHLTEGQRRAAREKAERHARGLLNTRGMSLAAKLEHYSIPEPNSGCILWTGWANEDGYGLLWWNGRVHGAHRLAFELANGPLSVGMDALHKCDVRCCINEIHLFPGTQADNNADMMAKGRHRVLIGEEHCQARLQEDDRPRHSGIDPPSGDQLMTSPRYTTVGGYPNPDPYYADEPEPTDEELGWYDDEPINTDCEGEE